MATIKYTSRLVSTAADGVLVETRYLKDEIQGKLQSEINVDLYQRIQNLSPESSGIVYIPKGSVDTYSDLPETPAPGDVYNVRSSVTLADGTKYGSGTNFVWSPEGFWDSLGGCIEGDGKLQEFKDEVSGKLEEIKSDIESVRDESKSYTDTRLNETIGWVELDSPSEES